MGVASRWELWFRRSSHLNDCNARPLLDCQWSSLLHNAKSSDFRSSCRNLDFRYRRNKREQEKQSACVFVVLVGVENGPFPRFGAWVLYATVQNTSPTAQIATLLADTSTLDTDPTTAGKRSRALVFLLSWWGSKWSHFKWWLPLEVLADCWG